MSGAQRQLTGPPSRPGNRGRAFDGYEGDDAFDSKRGDETIRSLRKQVASGEAQLSSLARAGGYLLTAMRARNWVTGLAIPIFAAISVGIAVVIVVGANNNGGNAPSLLSAGFPPARSATADFTSTATLAGRGVSQSLSQVATFGTTAVAVGTQAGTRITRPRFFYSANSGQTWQLAAVGADSPPGQSATLVAGGARGWVAVGGGFAFFSQNARSWQPSGPLPLQGGDKVITLTATASGFLAAGENVPAGGAGQATPVVWVSANGSNWQRVAGTQAGLTSGAGRALGVTQSASNGNTIVVAGPTATGGSASWRSTNGGTTWTPVTIPAGAGQSAALTGLAPLRTGFVAVRPANQATQAAVYVSADGTTWRQSATLATADGAALTTGLVSGGPTGAVVTGQATGLEFAFVSADGTTWTGTDPIGNADAERVSGVALTSRGQAIFAGTAAATGAASTGGQQQPVLSLVGAHGAATQVNIRAIAGAVTPEVAVNTVAANAGTQVAAGSADGLPALWKSADGGSTWTRATGATAAVLNRPGDHQLTSVTHGAAGWLAVGGTTAAAGGTTNAAAAITGPPVVVGSAAGQSWTAEDGAAIFGGDNGQTTVATAAGKSGYVIVGREVTGNRTFAAAWFAPGLTGWQRATDAQAGALEGAGNRQMNAVAATGNGFAAVGSDGPRPMAWLSASGRSWSAVTVPLPAGAASAQLNYIAAAGNKVAAVGTETAAGGRQVPFAAVSANGGSTWSLTALPLPKGGSGTVTALTAAGGGFTATGTEAQDVVVWLLMPGASPSSTWEVATPAGTGLAGPGTQAITGLANGGNTLTGVGFAGTATSEEPTIWQTPVRS